MRFLHLADLHIGKRVYDCSMIEEQRYILKTILAIVLEQKVDAVLIAGDVYDKQVPSAEAVQLFDDFLSGLSEKNVKVFVISGNHDSAERIAFGTRIMSKNGVYMSPVYNGKPEPITLQDEFGDIRIYMLPYIKPIHVRTVFGENEIKSYNDAVAYAVENMKVDSAERNVLLSHQFVTGAVTCDSEEMTIGGVENIDVSVYDDFDYVALGHIHSPQKCKRDTVRYAGSPLAYSFSERKHKKVAVVIELKEKGNVEVKEISLKPLHNMRELRGSYEELVSKKTYEKTATDDYLHVILTDEGTIPGAVDKMRIIYPNILYLEYEKSQCTGNASGKLADVKSKTPMELLQDFFTEQTGKEMSQEQEKLAEKVIRAKAEEGMV